MIEEIWSGGQTGVDQGALEGARLAGVRTGGYMPKGFLTEDGPRREFSHFYRLQETDSAEYPPRTRRNAKETDGTVWLEGQGEVLEDRGYRLTNSAAVAYGRPFLRIPIDMPVSSAVAELQTWIAQNNIEKLNIAGPCASQWPEGQARAREIVMALLPIR